uniref:Uncharacterized protein n=1 Tax=Rhizophora mucronata TaxID=61149 RepID=A0A2P2NVJ6_RHIMU
MLNQQANLFPPRQILKGLANSSQLFILFYFYWT